MDRINDGMKLTVKLRCDNEAFEEDLGSEVGRILRQVAERIESGDRDFSVQDANGNTIGTVALRIHWLECVPAPDMARMGR
jgi:N-acetylglutamate synthase-like GNAT family acetyltransferase